QKAGEPAGPRQELWQEGKPRPGARTQELLRTIAHVTLAQPRDRGVDRHRERREAREPSPLDRGAGDLATADQIELVPDGSGRRRLDVFEPAARQGRENVGGSRGAGGPGGRLLAARVEHAAAPDRRQEKRKLQA